MKKIFSLWRRKEESRSCSSDLRTGRTIAGSPSQLGYNLRDKDLKKLHRAASVGDLEKVKECLQFKKHDVNVRDKEFRTPLHLACANGFPNIVSLLIEKQCKINVLDSENRSPLIKAVQCQKESCATVLLDHDADPNLVDFDCNTALHYAVCGQSVSLVEKLLEHKANLEAQNKDGYTPLLLAITENNEKMVEFLLKRGADVNASDKSQRTALMIALSDEPTSLVSLLLQQNVDLSCQDIYGFTAEEYDSFNGFTVYHQLIANHGKEKKGKQTSYSENPTLGTTFGPEELKKVTLWASSGPVPASSQNSFKVVSFVYLTETAASTGNQQSPGCQCCIAAFQKPMDHAFTCTY
ncbi:ankyrin repeat domain-containing protein 7 [Choloepus didactylus]|uniref:ankyrin repeat domain-containing protein 7 n=1 Tax=Choloepus didactylus TaxID=27675 RepID=UPI0018A0D30F|nr:ankyrin repeat domain-containing protein 7 [Choloepus didactylus]